MTSEFGFDLNSQKSCHRRKEARHFLLWIELFCLKRVVQKYPTDSQHFSTILALFLLRRLPRSSSSSKIRLTCRPSAQIRWDIERKWKHWSPFFNQRFHFVSSVLIKKGRSDSRCQWGRYSIFHTSMLKETWFRWKHHRSSSDSWKLWNNAANPLRDGENVLLGVLNLGEREEAQPDIFKHQQTKNIPGRRHTHTHDDAR